MKFKSVLSHACSLDDTLRSLTPRPLAVYVFLVFRLLWWGTGPFQAVYRGKLRLSAALLWISVPHSPLTLLGQALPGSSSSLFHSLLHTLSSFQN